MAITGNSFFLDTNILVSATDRSRAHHSRALSLFHEVPKQGGHLVGSGQTIREYLVVVTRPLDENGLGLTAHQACQNVSQFSQHLHVLAEDERVRSHLTDLVRRYRVTGKRIHDANIVATMVAGGIHYCLTDNPTDFRVFKEITVLDSALNQS